MNLYAKALMISIELSKFGRYTDLTPERILDIDSAADIDIIYSLMFDGVPPAVKKWGL